MNHGKRSAVSGGFRSPRTFLSTLVVAALACFAAWFVPAPVAARHASANRPSVPATGTFNGRIAYTSTRNSQAVDIYAVNPDGSSSIRLTDDHGHAHNPDGPTYDFDQAWSPDGGKLAFVSNRDGDSFEIFTMNADGSNVQRLTNNTVDEFQPAWSPDGTRIAFTRGGDCAIVVKPKHLPADDDPCKAYIFLMNSDGSNQVKLSPDAGGDSTPVWSPDGSRIAFNNYLSYMAESNEIFVMNADGSNRVQITTNVASDYVSSWSPDGGKLAFFSNRDTARKDVYRFQLYTMNVDGSNTIRLTNNLFDDNYPVFSPDGTMIAFQRWQPSAVNPYDNYEIFVMNADGSSQTNITNNRVGDYGPPAWQPLLSPPQTPPPAVLQFETESIEANENSGSIVVTVTRLGNMTEATTVEYESADGTALDRSDYTVAFGTLRFAAGETSKSFSILITDDTFVENTETLVLSLHDLTGNATLKGSGQTVVSILDNDTAPAPSNPVEDSQFFVRQHYHDFFNREPDAPGFAFWVNNIESCGTDTHCREVKRIDTSAAFFLSVEFQQTGYYVYRLDTGALQAMPSYLEFMRDTQVIGKDLIVGAPNWEAQLEANTQKFTEEFVSRPRFESQYPEGMSAQAYVDRIYAHQYIAAPPAERNDAIAAYGSGDAAGRARALRIVANNQTFKQQQFNLSFVLMQYFGYLRRDPDFAGYDFWVIKLNQFNGDFRKAEMVKAFIVSGEYRQRFGPQ
jgi:Tol biopolymer transport system component